MNIPVGPVGLVVVVGLFAATPVAAQQLSCAWTDDPIVAGRTPIRAQHINELRDCLNRVLDTLNRSPLPPPPTYCTGPLPLSSVEKDHAKHSISFGSVWRTNCPSLYITDGLARFYSFTVSVGSRFRFNLTSRHVAHTLILRRGAGTGTETLGVASAAAGEEATLDLEVAQGIYTTEIARPGTAEELSYWITMRITTSSIR